MAKLVLTKEKFNDYLKGGIIIEKDNKFFTKNGDEVVANGRKEKALQTKESSNQGLGRKGSNNRNGSKATNKVGK